jgi:hypothetical protein
MGLWTLWVTGMLSISPQADTIVLGTLLDPQISRKTLFFLSSLFLAVCLSEAVVFA